MQYLVMDIWNSFSVFTRRSFLSSAIKEVLSGDYETLHGWGLGNIQFLWKVHASFSYMEMLLIMWIKSVSG